MKKTNPNEYHMKLKERKNKELKEKEEEEIK